MKKSLSIFAVANPFYSTFTQKIWRTCLVVLVSMTLFFLGSCKKDPPARDQFIASYSVVEACPSGNSNYGISISASTKSEEAVLLNNFADLGSSVTVDGSASGNSITIPSQTLNISVSGTRVPLTLSGSGTISGNSLNITYSYSVGTTGESCTMNCTKK